MALTFCVALNTSLMAISMLSWPPHSHTSPKYTSSRTASPVELRVSLLLLLLSVCAVCVERLHLK